MQRDHVLVLDLDAVQGAPDGGDVAEVLATGEGDQSTFGKMGGGLAVFTGAQVVAGVYGGRGEFAGLAAVRSVARALGIAGLGAVSLGGKVAHSLEGVAAVAEVLDPVGEEFQFARLDLGAVLLLAEIFHLGRDFIDTAVEALDMTPSVSTLQRLTLSMHECWESLGPETLGSIREAEGIPQDATTASVSLDGVMVPLRPGEDGRAKASWREAACGTVSFHDAEGKRLKTLYLGRMPESGKLTLKAQLASEVAHIRRARPEIGIVAIADGAADNWTFLETLSPETEVIDFWHACEHLQTASDHAVAPGWFEKYREILRHDPRGVAKVIRALRHLRDAAAAPDRAETERELAFFRKHRHRMRYHALKEEGIAIGSGVVEAANKTLVTQRMKRSGMRWRIVGGQAVLTFRALIKSGRFERAWKALISATDTPANDNISPRAAAMAIAA